jgi:hypothetical protein
LNSGGRGRIYGIIAALQRNRGRPGFDVGIETAQGMPRTSDLVNPSGNLQTQTTSVSLSRPNTRETLH